MGAGGIGCELLKNLALSGFKHLTVVDLDTIEVTNLNRQFLFQKQHVGQSKAVVARESVLRFNPRLDIVAHHADVMGPKFDQRFYEGFDLVLNALDNLKARTHVNRMCLAAERPLVESGSSGYLGQVTVHIKVTRNGLGAVDTVTQTWTLLCGFAACVSQSHGYCQCVLLSVLDSNWFAGLV